MRQHLTQNSGVMKEGRKNTKAMIIATGQQVIADKMMTETLKENVMIRATEPSMGEGKPDGKTRGTVSSMEEGKQDGMVGVLTTNVTST